MGKDDARQGRSLILTPSELKQGIINLGKALLPMPGSGMSLGSIIGEGLPVQGKTIQLGDRVFFGNNTYLGGYCVHVLPCLSPTIIVEPPPCNERPAVDRTPIPLGLVCYDSSRTMSEAQWHEIATQLGVEVALIKAIAWCETGGKGFNGSGKPIIRIEASWLKRFGISPPFGRASNNWEDFEKLLKQGHKLGQTEKYEIALIASTSFGLFQTMGLAYLDYGTRLEPDSHWGGWVKGPKLRAKNPEKALGLLRRFKDAMMGNEFNQGQYFVNFVKAKPALLRAMQRLEVPDWCTIAKLYNGTGFVENHKKQGGYDMALISYYLQFGGVKKDSAQTYKSLYQGRARPCLSVAKHPLPEAASAPVEKTRKLTRPVEGKISSDFGPRQSPTPGASSWHKGIDIAAPLGTPIRAADTGTVIFTGEMGGFGKTVIIDHGGGVVTLYAHCSEIKVSNGAIVQRGDTVAEVGNTGRSTGPHLHFEVRTGTKPGNPLSGTPVNPITYFEEP